MSGTFDETEGKKRISFKGPEGEHLLQVALRADTASPEELKELAAEEYGAHRERKHEIERLWGDDPDEPPLAERWHEQQDYEEICDAIRNPQEYVGQARAQGLLPAFEPKLKEAQLLFYADDAVDVIPTISEQDTLTNNEPRSGEQAPFFKQTRRAIQSPKTLAICVKILQRERDGSEIDIEI